MTDTVDQTKARKIPPTYDNRGNPSWKMRMSPPDDTFAMCLMVPDRIIPVIFVPGVMGSNLRGVGQAVGTNWTLNSNWSMKGWLRRGAKKRKAALTPTTMEVDNRGAIPQGTPQHDEELERRGWGEVGALTYSEFLVWLENALNDYADPHAGERVKLMRDSLRALVGEQPLSNDEVGISYRYRFPVHAFGYNWLQSNAQSARQLGQRIDAVITRYKREHKKCEKVILVTHSMGGLVARHCSEVGGYRDKIFGVVHGVMPAIGAAAVYRRFKAGTEGAYLAGKVLGEDAAEMTAVLSSAPGPLQLLPTPEYGNGWLVIRDQHTNVSLPSNGDPYGEIYTVRGKWWSMCEDTLINPLNEEKDAKKRAMQVDADWVSFRSLIDEEVQPFHQALKEKYHANTHAFYGSDPSHRAYGNVTWRGGSISRKPQTQGDLVNAKQARDNQLDTTRDVDVQVPRPMSRDPTRMQLVEERRRFTISEPDELGDGTVPLRSGAASKSACKSFLEVKVGHEPAFKLTEGQDNLRACRFTLRSIVKIAQDVQQTALKYE